MNEVARKAQLVTLVGEITKNHGDVMKIVRPCSEAAPTFEIYTERAGLYLAFPFDSEVGRVLSQLVGDEGVSYHQTVDSAEGLVFEGEPLEGLSW